MVSWKTTCKVSLIYTNKYFGFYLTLFIFYRISIQRLESMIQMHSYLVTNSRSELKFLDEKITSEELDETFNKIALSMENGVDLFDDNDEMNENDIIFEDCLYDETIDPTDLQEVNNNDLE